MEKEDSYGQPKLVCVVAIQESHIYVQGTPKYLCTG